jgi:hypothetical protein
MGILDDVKAEVRTGTTNCKTCAWLREQSAADQAEWTQAMAEYPPPVVHRAMVKHGYPGRSEDAVRNHHRRGDVL